MSILQNASKGVLEFIGQNLWGFKPNLMKDIVEQNGGPSSVLWFARNMPTYERILKAWGPIRTHLLASEISVLNGCPYCTFGHIYAAQLHFLEITGSVMSVDEDEVVSWHKLDEATKIANFRKLILENELDAEMALFDRMLELRAGNGSNGSKRDRNIEHLLQMFAYLNACGIKGNTANDQSHDPINLDTALKEKYARIRA